MDRTNKIIFWIVLLLIVGGFLANFLCKVGAKCKKCSQFSLSKEEAFDRNLLVTSYKPGKSNIRLKYSNETVTFSELWIEHGWFINSNICLWKRLKKTDEFNATIEFKKSGKDTYNFDLEGNGVGWGIRESSKIVTLNSLPDTLTFYIVEKNPEQRIGWKEKMNGDTLIFLKTADNAR